MERNKSNTITIEEQRAAGLLREQTNYVPAVRDRAMPPMPVNSQVAHVIDAAPLATQYVEMRTSAVDRALGFTIASLPLFGGFALVVLLCCVYFASVPFLSLPALVIFWLSFVAAWVVGYAYTLSISAEGVSHYESREKWGVIRDEHRLRWLFYAKQAGIDLDDHAVGGGWWLVICLVCGLIAGWYLWG